MWWSVTIMLFDDWIISDLFSPFKLVPVACAYVHIGIWAPSYFFVQ